MDQRRQTRNGGARARPGRPERAADAGAPPRGNAHGRFSRAAGAASIVAALVAAPWGPALPAQSPSRAAAVASTGAGRAAVEAARRFLCPHGGTPMRGGRCRGGRAVAAADGRDLSVRDWDAGIPTAMRRQAPCPEGTVQARPLFWNDAVRCLPQ